MHEAPQTKHRKRWHTFVQCSAAFATQHILLCAHRHRQQISAVGAEYERADGSHCGGSRPNSLTGLGFSAQAMQTHDATTSRKTQQPKKYWRQEVPSACPNQNYRNRQEQRGNSKPDKLIRRETNEWRPGIISYWSIAACTDHFPSLEPSRLARIGEAVAFLEPDGWRLPGAPISSYEPFKQHLTTNVYAHGSIDSVLITQVLTRDGPRNPAFRLRCAGDCSFPPRPCLRCRHCDNGESKLPACSHAR